MSFRPATRQGIKPLIGLMGKSSGGKTYSGLLLARGIVGPKGKVALIDTENGRGSIFADQIPGGYLVDELNPPFAPSAYATKIDEALAEKPDILVVDSMTHEWNGEGGYLQRKEECAKEMAERMRTGNSWDKFDKCRMAAAAREKPSHNLMIAKITRCQIPVILCFRGKQKINIDQKEGQKTKIETDDQLSAIQDGEFIFEMLIAGEVYAQEGTSEGGYFRCTKHTHPDLKKILPADGERITVAHGEALAKWCADPKAVQPTSNSSPSLNPKQLKQKIWASLKRAHGDDVPKSELALRQVNVLKDGEQLATLTNERLAEVWASVQQLYPLT